MSRPRYCPGCGTPLSSDQCRECNWIFEAPPERGHNHQCAYSDSGTQCPMRGTICDSTKPGPETKWYCRYHYNWYENPREASQNLSAILSGQIQQSPKRYTDIVHEQKMASLRKTNPELFHQPINDQDRGEYVSMITAYMKQQAKLMELPYKKQKRFIDNSEEVLTGHEITQEQIEKADTSKYAA